MSNGKRLENETAFYQEEEDEEEGNLIIKQNYNLAFNSIEFLENLL